MGNIVEKLSSYNIINNLLPGAFFVMLSNWFNIITIPASGIVEMIFVYYFFGLIVSRVGSLIVEALCLKFKFIKYAPKNEYVMATKADPRIETLLETSNFYRTCSGMIITLAVCRIYKTICIKIDISYEVLFWIISIALFALFIFSFCKQTKHIYKRVLCANEDYYCKEN